MKTILTCVEPVWPGDLPEAEARAAHAAAMADLTSRYAEDEKPCCSGWALARAWLGMMLLLLPSYCARAWRTCWTVRWLVYAGLVIEGTHAFTAYLWPHLKAILEAGR